MADKKVAPKPQVQPQQAKPAPKAPVQPTKPAGKK
jgi:hypothetical protein